MTNEPRPQGGEHADRTNELNSVLMEEILQSDDVLAARTFDREIQAAEADENADPDALALLHFQRSLVGMSDEEARTAGRAFSESTGKYSVKEPGLSHRPSTLTYEVIPMSVALAADRERWHILGVDPSTDENYAEGVQKLWRSALAARATAEAARADLARAEQALGDIDLATFQQLTSSEGASKTLETETRGRLDQQSGDLPYTMETSLGTASITARQESTRGDGTVELSGDKFSRDAVDFSAVAGHLSIHQDGAVAGSQFRGDLFPGADSVTTFLSQALPESLQFDQHGMVELTLEVDMPQHEALGFSGVKSIAELETAGVSVESSIRTPGGEPAVEDGIPGAWYPELVRDSSTGQFVVKTTESGEVANPHGKFEPEAKIATVTNPESAATNKVSVVMRRDPESGSPVVLTAYPGEIAPPFPAKITTEAFSMDSLRGASAEYWTNHAFVRFAE